MDVIQLRVRIEAMEVDKLGWVQVSELGGMSRLPRPLGQGVDVVITHDDYGEVWRPRYGREETDAPSGTPTEAQAPDA